MELKQKSQCGVKEFIITLTIILAGCAALMLSFYFTDGFGIIKGERFLLDYLLFL